MQQIYKHIILVGFSTGGLLSLVAASRREKGLLGVVSINSPLALNSMQIRTLVPAVHFWNEMLDYFNTHTGQIESSMDEPYNPAINYNVVYVRSLNELNNLMIEVETILSEVNLPLLILQADNDSVVNPSSAELIYMKANSQDKTKKMFHSDEHDIAKVEVLTEVLKEIKQFIAKLSYSS